MATQIFIGFLSFLFVTLVRMNSLKKDAEAANLSFNYKRYFDREVFGLAASVVSIILWAYLYPEVVLKYPAIEGWIRASFFAMGAMGSWVLQMLLGKTKVWIRNVVDVKTNIADGIKNKP